MKRIHWDIAAAWAVFIAGSLYLEYAIIRAIREVTRD